MISVLVNLDILSVAIVIAGTGILGFAVYFSNPRNSTNKAFFALTIVTILWGTFNYLITVISDPKIGIMLIRVVLFFAVWHAFTFFHLFFIFPKSNFTAPWWYTKIIIPGTALMSIILLTPLGIESIKELSATGIITKLNNGPVMPVFAISSISLVVYGLARFVMGAFQTTKNARGPYWMIFAGTATTAICLIIFNLILPAFYDNASFIPLGAVFIFPFIICSYIAITRHKLFNVKVIASGVLVFLLAVITFGEVVFAKELSLIIYRGSIFALVLVFGILLIRSVKNEVEQREHIEILATNLKVANEKLKELDVLKSQFLSMASHDLRAPLTIIRNFVSLLLEGAYGKLADAGQEGLKQVFDRATDMAKSVETYLDVSRIEQGKMKYDFIDIEVLPLIKNSITSFEPTIAKKGLKLTTSFDESLNGIKAKIDVSKMNEVLNNLIDNTIKYTPEGEIWFTVKKVGNVARISIKDTGVGMTKNTLDHLFQLFRPGEDSKRVNPASTGVGLYITKSHILAHNGTVTATSEGAGKGSSFIVELPLLA